MKRLLLIWVCAAGISAAGYGWTERDEGLAVRHEGGGEGLTAFHAEYPFGSVVRVTNLENNRQVRVRIVDRMEKISYLIIDLSDEAAAALDMGAEFALVRVEFLRRRETHAPKRIELAWVPDNRY
jgi:rare lipoprotein A (peptidoglycan hydrolase)